MVKTTVINGTGKIFLLKEGNAGIFRLLKKLPPNESYQIVADRNATYREYWCQVEGSGLHAGVVLSSDDVADLKEITIIETGTEPNISYSYTGVSRKPKTTEGEVETAKHGGSLTWLRGIFSRILEKGSSSKSPV